MINDFKNAFKEVFGLKFFWIYMVIYAVIQTVSTIFNLAESIPYNKAISNVFSVIGYISIAYLLVMVHNLLNDKNLSDETQNFWQNFKNSIKVWFKGVIGLTACMVIIFSGTFVSSVLLVVSMMISKPVLFDEIVQTPLFIIIFGLIMLLTILGLIFVLELVSICFAKNYAIRDVFRWGRVVKTFFKKGFAKRTCSILGIEILASLILLIVLLGVYLVFDLGLTYSAKNLLANNYMLLLFLFGILNIIIPFVASALHFMLSSAVYNLLAKVYKESSEVTE